MARFQVARVRGPKIGYPPKTGGANSVYQRYDR